MKVLVSGAAFGLPAVQPVTETLHGVPVTDNDRWIAFQLNWRS